VSIGKIFPVDITTTTIYNFFMTLQHVFYVAKIKADAPSNRKKRAEYYREIAEKLDISYFTLHGKLNKYGKFTNKQIQALKSIFG